MGVLALMALLPGAAPQVSLDVSFTALRSTRGIMRVCLTADPAHFPDCSGDRHAVTRSVPASEGVLHITGMAPGDYALSVIHDENGNAKLDTFAGIPKEGIGFSRNPRLMFGPPRFEAVRFTLGSQGGQQSVRMRYFL